MEKFFTMLDITDPSGITAGRGGGLPKFDVLDAPTDVTTIEIKGIPYALVTASDDDGLQIINMSDPSSPIPVAGVTDGNRFILDGAYKIAAAEIGDRYYALVTAGGHFQIIGGTFQIIGGGLQIIDITNPANPSPTASVTDTTTGFGATEGFGFIDVAEIDGHHYALADDRTNTVYVINVTDPTQPEYVSNATDGNSGFVIRGLLNLVATEINDGHYALVSSRAAGSFQVIDVTNPANPVAAGLAVYREDGFTKLAEPAGVAATEIGGRHYALVTSIIDDGVQIIDITNPYSLSAATAFGPPPINSFAAEVMQIGGHHYALMTGGSEDEFLSLHVINITDPSDPLLVTTV